MLTSETERLEMVYDQTGSEYAHVWEVDVRQELLKQCNQAISVAV